MPNSVSCGRDGCDKRWSRDPCLEVSCPTCGADVGQRCKRPSGWGGPFVQYHKERDLLADREGHYGECPNDRCGSANTAEQTTLVEVSPRV